MQKTLQFLFLTITFWALNSCAPSPHTKPDTFPLNGVPKSALLQCAGQPLQEKTIQEHTSILTYYREQTMLDESMVVSKSSAPKMHHGCWANILVEDDAVIGIEFRPVPNEHAVATLCEEIFRGCHSQ